MNRLFAELVEQHTPKMNPDVVNGLACLHVPRAQAWLDGVFRSASKSFPAGLRYEGIERCSPYEEFLETTKLRSNKRIFDLAESDLFMVRIKLSFEDESGIREQLPDRYLYLPFVNEAGIFRISGSMYHISGVLSDRVISPGVSNIFVRLLRDRLRFFHVGHSVMVGNQRETFNVVWSNIYRTMQRDKGTTQTTRANSSVAHYLFAKYGFTETFRKWAGFVPVVKMYDPDQEATPGVILCRSAYYGTTKKPATYIGNMYIPSKLCIEIPEQHWNQATAALVAGFFYVIDHFPERFTPDRLDSPFIWSVLLGHIVFSGLLSEAKLFERISDHFNSLDDYLDVLVRDKLKEIGMEIEDFYELIALIMIKFPDLLHGGQIDVNSMYTKNVEILYYLLFDITSKIFKAIYHLRKLKARKPLTMNVVKEAFNKNLTPRTIFRITKNRMIVEVVSYCGDHKFFKMTSKVTEQEAGSSGGRKPKRTQITESNHFHASMAECGNILFLSKSNPMPTNRLNPYVNIDKITGAFIPNPKLAKQIEELHKQLTTITGVNPDNYEDNGDLLDEENIRDLIKEELAELGIEEDEESGDEDIEEADVEVE